MPVGSAHAEAFDYAMMVAQQINDGATTVDPTLSGEANTASNVNTAGVGVYKRKTGVDLEFRGIKAADGTAVVALDAATNEIRVSVGTGIPLASVTDAASAAGLAAAVADIAALSVPSDPRNYWFEDFAENATAASDWLFKTDTGGGLTCSATPAVVGGAITMEVVPGAAGPGSVLYTSGLALPTWEPTFRAGIYLFGAMDSDVFKIGPIGDLGVSYAAMNANGPRAQFVWDDAANQWACVVRGAGAATSEAITLGATGLDSMPAPDADNDPHVFEIVFDGDDTTGTITFKFDGVTIHVADRADGPADTVVLGMASDLLAGASATVSRGVVVDYLHAAWTSPASRIPA